MRLSPCKQCGGAVRDRAVACPHCGAPLRLWIVRLRTVNRGEQWQRIGAFTLIGAIVAMALGARDWALVLMILGFVAFVVGRFR